MYVSPHFARSRATLHGICFLPSLSCSRDTYSSYQHFLAFLVGLSYCPAWLEVVYRQLGPCCIFSCLRVPQIVPRYFQVVKGIPGVQYIHPVNIYACAVISFNLLIESARPTLKPHLIPRRSRHTNDFKNCFFSCFLAWRLVLRRQNYESFG